MNKKLNPIIQAIALVLVPLIVLFLINFITIALGKGNNNSAIVNTLKGSLFVVPSALFIILHKYKLSNWGLIIASLATFIALTTIPKNDLGELSLSSLYAMNFIYFSLFIVLTKFAYFLISGFKLKNIMFIVGGIVIHSLLYSLLFLINTHSVSGELIKAIVMTATNTYLMVGLALAIGLLFFDIPQPYLEVMPGLDDDDDDDL